MPDIILTGSVGIGGKNNKADILNIQIALNQRLKLIAPTARLKEDGDLGTQPEKSKTIAAIMAFQKMVVGTTNPDGLIDVNGKTHKKLNATSATTLPAGNSELLTFPGTNFTHGKTKKTLTECLDTLPVELRPDFKANISQIIREMHKLGVALGIIKKYKAGYRTFLEQYTLPSTATKAGPGESFHNYGLATDLGVLDWVDNKGNSHADFWLSEMDKIPEYKGFSSKIWAKRNALGGNNMYSLSWEIIHLQGVPATTSGMESLAKCLNEAAKSGSFSYQAGIGISKAYQCKVSKTANWVIIGTAKELWAGIVKNVTADEKKTIISHMKKAESIAKTIKL